MMRVAIDSAALKGLGHAILGNFRGPFLQGPESFRSRKAVAKTQTF